MLVLDPGTIVILVAPSFLRAYGNRQLGELPGYRGVPPPDFEASRTRNSGMCEVHGKSVAYDGNG